MGGHAAYGYPPTGVMPVVKRVSTGLYLAIFWLGFVATGVLTGMGASNTAIQELLLVSWMPAILSIVVFWMLLFKAWAALQDGRTRTTPGAAVGFMFIPFFNFYWIFIAIGSWGREYNAFADRNGIRGYRTGESLFLVHSILAVIPLVSIATVFTLTPVLVRFCRGINAVADRHALPVAVAHRVR